MEIKNMIFFFATLGIFFALFFTTITRDTIQTLYLLAKKQPICIESVEGNYSFKFCEVKRFSAKRE